MDDRFTLDTAVVRRSFNKARQSFDSAAVVQREVRQRALERLRLLKAKPSIILDLGAGTGHGSAWLRSQFPHAQIIALDGAMQLLYESNRLHRSWWRGRQFSHTCADAAALPFRDASIDWVFSNLMLSWCASIDSVLREVKRVVKPGGVFSFTAYGPDTLKELRHAWRAVDMCGHVHPFIDMHDLGDALVRAGFSDPVLDVEHLTLTYSDIRAVTADLKATGSCNALPTRARGLYGRNKFAKLTAAYELLRQDGKLPATYEVVYGQAWQSESKSRSVSGEIRIPLEGLRGRRGQATSN